MPKENSKNEPVRKLQVYTHEFAPKHGGIATYCHEFAKAASLLGYQTTVYAPTDATAISVDYTLEPQNWKGDHNPSSLFKAHFALRQLYSEATEDTHHLIAEPGSILAYGSLPKSLRQSGHTHIVLHGSEVQRWRSGSIARTFAGFAFETASSIIAVSDYVTQLAQESFPDHRTKLKTVLNALPSSLLEQSPPQPKTTTQDPQAPVRLLSVGRIHPRKGFDHIIRALGKLTHPIHYTIVGGSKDSLYAQKLQSLAAQHKVDLQLELDASPEQLKAHYLQADLFALTSVPYKKSIEGFGLVYLEAGYYGLPCVAYNVGGVSQAVRHNVTGRICTYDDLNELAENIQFFADNPEVRHRFGAQNQTHALSRDWQDIVRETLQP